MSATMVSSAGESKEANTIPTLNTASGDTAIPYKSSLENTARIEGESEAARIERLGRQRPQNLGSLWKEIGFVFSIVMSQALTEYFVSGFTILIPTVVTALDIPPAAVTWPASAFSLVVSCCLLPFGRLADMYGGFPVYIAGNVWYCVWSLITGFSQNEIMLDVCRGLQGLGPAAFLPASLTLLGNMYRPGPRKNMVFSIYGAMAPFGFFIGIFFAGIAGRYLDWRWYFYIGTILAFLTAIIAYVTIPNDYAHHKNNGIKMDWLGSATIIVGLVLFVFAITESSHAPRGWSTPYIYATFVLAILILGAAFYVEGWVAEQPLLPFEVFKIKYMRPFILGLLFAYGPLGVFLLYATLYCRNILGISAIQMVAWYVPCGLGGVILAIAGGFILHLVHPTILMLISCIATIINALLFGILPRDPGYWPWIFPAMCCATISIDLIFNVGNIFFSTSLPAHQQGLAGSISNVIMQFGVALMLGFADVVVSFTAYQGQRQSYKNAFWFELALGAAAGVILIGFVRIGRAKSDLTVDEKRARDAQEGTADSFEASLPPKPTRG